jgi:tellurite resistance protein
MNTITELNAAHKTGMFTYLPVALFGSVMGLCGLAVSWRIAHELYGAPEWVSKMIGAVAVLSFIALAIAYGIKAISCFRIVRAELNHPIAGNLFGTALISVLLLPILIAPYELVLARVVWATGAVGMTLFAWFIVSRWLHVKQLTAHATPAWIVPVVGMLDVPLAVPALQWTDMQGVMMLGLAVGMFFALPLFTMIMSRLLFEDPLPPAMEPSLMIMLAPFSVGFSSYVATTGRIDGFAQALYMLTLFLLAVLLGRLRHLMRCCPFRVSWWAVSFPLASAATAALRYAGAAHAAVTDGIAITLLAFATLVIGGLLIRTLDGIAKGELKTLTE